MEISRKSYSLDKNQLKYAKSIQLKSRSRKSPQNSLPKIETNVKMASGGFRDLKLKKFQALDEALTTPLRVLKFPISAKHGSGSKSMNSSLVRISRNKERIRAHHLGKSKSSSHIKISGYLSKLKDDSELKRIQLQKINRMIQKFDPQNSVNIKDLKKSISISKLESRREKKFKMKWKKKVKDEYGLSRSGGSKAKPGTGKKITDSGEKFPIIRSKKQAYTKTYLKRIETVKNLKRGVKHEQIVKKSNL